MDIDEIFKRPPLPKGSLKRSFDAGDAAAELPDTHKSLKRDEGQSASSSSSSRAGPSVRDYVEGDDEDDDDDGRRAGRAGDDDARDFAPGGDADYYAEEDEDGRFFGGGLSKTQKDILNIMDTGNDGGAADDEEEGGAGAGGARPEAPGGIPGVLTAATIKKQLLMLERAIDKNREMRTRFPDDPTKFVDSEFTLIEALRALMLYSSKPALAYPLVIANNTLGSLSDLLTHENTDVVGVVVEVIEDWTDEDVLEPDDDDDEGEGEGDGGQATSVERKLEVMRALVDDLGSKGTLASVISTLERFDEDVDEERAGVYHTLAVVENLVALSPLVVLELIKRDSPLFSWLIRRFCGAQDKASAERDQNRFYAAEILAILLATTTTDEGVREARRLLTPAVDDVLGVLAAFRNRDPSGAEETEFMENVFDLLCSALSEPEVKRAFLDGEGVELMVIMMKNKRLSRLRAIKTLDHALAAGDAGDLSGQLCERFVEALGLKTLFAAFMSTAGRRKGGGATAASTATTHEDTEHMLSVMASLFTSLASETPARIRLLTKFVEDDYAKTDRLVEVREDVERRVEHAAQAALAASELGMDDDELYMEKLEKGLASLQYIDYIIAWLCQEDDGVREHIVMLLGRKDRSLAHVSRVLHEYHDNIGDPSSDADDDGAELRAIVEQLLVYLDSLL